MKTLKSVLISAENLQHVQTCCRNYRKLKESKFKPLSAASKMRPMQLQSVNLAALNTRTVIFYNKLCVVQSQWPHKTHPDVHKPGGYIIAVGVAAIIWNVLSIITSKVNAKSTRGIMLPNISLSLFKLELKNWSCATSLTTTAALWYLLCMLCWYTKQQCVQPLCTRLQKAADTVTYFLTCGNLSQSVADLSLLIGSAVW